MEQDVLQGVGSSILDITSLSAATVQNTITDLDIDNHRIPLRELFINVDIIRDAFTNNSNVNEAVIEILEVLNEDSMGIFDLKLIT